MCKDDIICYTILQYKPGLQKYMQLAGTAGFLVDGVGGADANFFLNK